MRSDTWGKVKYKEDQLGSTTIWNNILDRQHTEMKARFLGDSYGIMRAVEVARRERAYPSLHDVATERKLGASEWVSVTHNVLLFYNKSLFNQVA